MFNDCQKQFLRPPSSLFSFLLVSERIFDLSFLSAVILLLSLFGLLLEERLIVRFILLLEIALSAIIGYSAAFYGFIGVFAGVLSVVILVVAAVESIVLFSFVILLFQLHQTIDLSKFYFLQS